jgi:hypothetical protein
MSLRAALSALVVFAACAAAARADEQKKEAQKPAAKNAALEQFKQLAGEWVGKEEKAGHEKVHANYKVTSGGSAVVETLLPGTDMEMVSVIHADGDDLVLTHYCAVGNQPTMKAETKGDSKKVDFKFLRATNLKSDKDMHMHDVSFTFVDKDTLKAEWTHYQDGKPAGSAVFLMKRKNAHPEGKVSDK